jgi:hypothetical protein
MKRRHMAVRFVTSARGILATGIVISLMLTSAPLSSADNESVPAALPSLSVRVIGPASGADTYLPNGVNNSGVVAGTEVSPVIDRGFYFAKGSAHAIPPPKGKST